MIEPKGMVDAVLNWPGLIIRPLWQQIALQLLLVSAFGLCACWWLIGDVRRVVLDTDGQAAQAREAAEQVRQQLDAMPPLAELQAQLAGQTAQGGRFQADRLAMLIAVPLSRAGATLLSWQPTPHDGGVPHPARWQLTFSTGYTGVLQVLDELTALPYVLRIEQLTMKPDTEPNARQSEMRRLRVELILNGAEEQS